MAASDTALGPDVFDAATCQNCGAALGGPFCAACGQKRAERFSFDDVFQRFWWVHQWLDPTVARSAARMALRPGLVAREYVLGVRKPHVHPFKLVLFAVGLLIWVLGRTEYLTAGQGELTEQMRVVEAWGRGSFTLGFFAVLGASLLVYRQRLGYNALEHVVLAAYAQFLILAANVVNLLPLLVLDASWVVRHRAASGLYMDVVEVAIVTVAFVQFFRVRVRDRDGVRVWEVGRLALAVGAFYVAKSILQYGYARLIVHFAL
ncbi:DUF3667 domain-containing protein [Rubrivirga sp.]|uniref:DUF3667 domain-containing protein n=1 Tax=Rubrivirga sp. TaxID=1885344 RepID=UPI003B51C38F